MNVIFTDDNIMTVRSLAGYAFPYSISMIDIEITIACHRIFLELVYQKNAIIVNVMIEKRTFCHDQ